MSTLSAPSGEVGEQRQELGWIGRVGNDGVDAGEVSEYVAEVAVADVNSGSDWCGGGFLAGLCDAAFLCFAVTLDPCEPVRADTLRFVGHVLLELCIGNCSQFLRPR